MRRGRSAGAEMAISTIIKNFRLIKKEKSIKASIGA